MERPLRVSAGHHHFDHRAAPFVAQAFGWFEAEGAGDVEVTASGEDDRTVAALAAGLIDIGLDISPAKVLADHLAGGALVVVGGMASGIGQVLAAMPGIDGVAGLRERRIQVVEQGSGVDWHPLRILLRQHGIDPDRDVTLVHGAPYPLFANADRDFRAGLMDARMVLHAEAGRLCTAGYAVLHDFLAAYPHDYPQRVITTSRGFVARHGARLQAFLRAMLRAYRFLRDEARYAEAMAIVRQAMPDDPGLGFPPGITDHFLGTHYFGFKQMPHDGAISLSSLQRYIDEEALEGRTRGGIAAASVLDNGPVSAAAAAVTQRFGRGYV